MTNDYPRRFAVALIAAVILITLSGSGRLDSGEDVGRAALEYLQKDDPSTYEAWDTKPITPDGEPPYVFDFENPIHIKVGWEREVTVSVPHDVESIRVQGHEEGTDLTVKLSNRKTDATATLLIGQYDLPDNMLDESGWTNHTEEVRERIAAALISSGTREESATAAVDAGIEELVKMHYQDLFDAIISYSDEALAEAGEIATVTRLALLRELRRDAWRFGGPVPQSTEMAVWQLEDRDVFMIPFQQDEVDGKKMLELRFFGFHEKRLLFSGLVLLKFRSDESIAGASTRFLQQVLSRHSEGDQRNDE